MRRPVVSMILAAMTGIAACAPQAPVVDLEAELASLKAVDARYAQVAGDKDLEGIVALYAPDAVVYPPEVESISGLEGIRGMMEAFMADPSAGGVFTPLYAQVSQGGDMGYTMDLVELTQTGPDGMPVVERARDFHVWRKDADGSWKLVVDIWNAAPPQPAP